MNRTPPPVGDLATLQAWPTNTGPGQLRRPQSFNRQAGFSAGGSAVVPANAAAIFDMRFVARSNGTLVYAVGTSAVKVIDAPPEKVYRNWAYLRNSSPNSTDILYVDFDRPAEANSAIRLAQNESLMLDNAIDQGDIWVICATATGQLSIQVSNIILPI